MKNNSFKISIMLVITVSVSSCATYLIPVESLKAQFFGIDSSKFVNVIVGGPVGERYNYLANPITIIKCISRPEIG